MPRIRISLAALLLACGLSVGGGRVASAGGVCVYYPNGQRTLGVCHSTGRVHRVWTRCGLVILYSPFFNDEEWVNSPSCSPWVAVTGRGITWP